MLNKKDVEQAIRECENARESYQNCEKLATFYTIYDHLFTEAQPKAELQQETVIGDYGDSELMMAVEGKDAEKVWAVIEELGEVLKATNPPLYQGVIRKMADI